MHYSNLSFNIEDHLELLVDFDSFINLCINFRGIFSICLIKLKLM